MRTDSTARAKEMHAAIYRALRDVEVSEETLGFNAICEAVLGDGHFLGSAQTYAAMERDYVYPRMADREQPRTWAENGAQDIWQVARAKAQAILDSHHPDYLTRPQDAAILLAFPIQKGLTS